MPAAAPLTASELDRAARGLKAWLRRYADSDRDIGAGVVFGLSGGVDSALVAALCRRTLGPERCLGVIMPCHSDPADVVDAKEVARVLDFPHLLINLDEIHDRLTAFLPGDPGGEDSEAARLARANLKPRLRMMVLYYLANLQDRLVVGTGNRSELHVGYFTKYGDGGVDLLPIGGLVKGEVRQLARHLGVPERVLAKPPSAGLWQGQTDEEEMGLSYPQLDRLLLTGEGPPGLVQRVQAMHRRSAHKRVPPPVGPSLAELLSPP